MAKEIRYELNINDYSFCNQGEVYEVLKNILHLSEHEISQCKFDGEILVNGERVHVNSHMKVSDILIVRFPEDKVHEVIDVDEEPDILFETDDFVAVNKPSGIPTHASYNHLNDSTGTILISHYQKQGIPFTARSIGRLDNEVSGVVLFAKNQPVASRLNAERKTGQLRKIYIAYAEGIFDEQDGTISLPLSKAEEGKERVVDHENGQKAITRYQVMEEREINGFSFSIVAVTIITGRTHQIRAHFKAIGHPLLGDTIYGGNMDYIDRVALHAAKMEFISPFTEEKINISAPLADDMKDVVKNSSIYEQIIETDEKTKELTEEILRPVQEEIKEEKKEIPREEVAVVLEEEKKSHKVLIVIFVLTLLGLISFGIYYFVTNYYKPMLIEDTEVVETRTDDELYDSLIMAFNDIDTVQLNSEFDPMLLVESYEGEITVLHTLDTSKSGTQHIVYKLSIKNQNDKDIIRVYVKEITVKGSEVGAVFEATSVTIKAGTEFDPRANIKGIYDSNGTELTYSEELVEGTYIIESDVNNQKEGTYTVTIKMMDESGATSKASYEVIVKGTIGTNEPVIWIRKDEITITKGTTYDVINNVISVSDSKGNALAYAKSEKVGSYTITTDFNYQVVGTYSAKLIATDSEGNKGYDDWKIIVKEPSPTTTSSSSTDLTAPKIWIYKDEITLRKGTTYDVASNVMSVTDDVDGKLPYSATEAKGTYTIVTNFNVQTPGTYDVQLIAIDNAGNKSTDEWKIMVLDNSSSDGVGPYILIRYDNITIKTGANINLKSNVISVTDAIDGTIPYADSEQLGKYTIVSDLNIYEPGVYNVQLIALDKEGNRTTDEWTITVESKPDSDSTPPQIWIYQDYFTVTVGANYNLFKNIMSVTDDVDGALPYSETEANGSYTLVSSFNINTAGEYSVQLIATDSSGNKSYDDWIVNVVNASGEDKGDGSSNSDQIYNYLTGTVGLNRAATIGIMANIKRESSYNPDTYNNSGNYGLCQWGGSRYRRLMEFCNNNGLDYRTVSGQVRYIEYELNNYYTSVLSQLQGVEDSKDGAYNAGYIFAEQYEGAGPGYPEQAGESAKSMY